MSYCSGMGWQHRGRINWCRTNFEPEARARDESLIPRSRFGLKRSRQDDTEAVAELGQVGSVNRAVAVEIEQGEIARVGGHGPEGVSEGGQVQAVDRLVAVEVAVEAEEIQVQVAAG